MCNGWCVGKVGFAAGIICIMHESWSLELVTNWIIESLTLPIISCTDNALHCEVTDHLSIAGSAHLHPVWGVSVSGDFIPFWCHADATSEFSHGQGFTSNSGDDPTTSYWGSAQGVGQWGCFFGMCDWREVEACIEALLNLGCFQLPAFRL